MAEPRPDQPLLPYSRHWVDEDDIARVVDVLRGDWLTTGPCVEAFEAALAARGGARHAVAVQSGTAALHAIYAVAGVAAGRNIVTTPLTFVATASTALLLGATVRFADIEADTGTIDPDAARAAMDVNTALLVAVDYAGHPADYDALRSVAAERGVRLIADAAHSLGAGYRGRPAGALADATVFSFHPVKSITTGEGGAVLTDDAAWARAARAFRSHGVVRDHDSLRDHRGAWYYEVQSLGLNYRIPDILCALGLGQLEKLDRFIARRRALARRYSEALAGCAELELPVTRPDVEPSWHLYPVRVRAAARRDAFFEALRRLGLGAQVHYIPVHLHSVFRDLGYRPGECPRAEDFAAREVSIPLHAKMTDAEAERVIEAVTLAVRETM